MRTDAMRTAIVIERSISMPALEGMRILDMTQYEAGTSCTQALAWLGADAVKIERPGTGDPSRRKGQGSGPDPEYFINWNSNKRSITLDLRSERGRDILLRLVPRFDVFVENFGPGVVEKLKIGYDVMKEIDPGIIYARIKGFGTSGPYAAYKCFDMVAQAAAGAYSVTGERDGPPMQPGATVGDSGTGVQMALAITAAYVQKLQTGMGQLVELSMQEAMIYYMRTAISMTSSWGERPATRNGNGTQATINVYPCSPFGPNDYISIVAVTPQMWRSLCETVGREDLLNDDRARMHPSQWQNADTLIAAVTDWTRQHTKEEAMHILGEAGVPASATFDTRELFDNPHLKERGFVHTVKHKEHGDIRLMGWGPRMSESQVPIQAAPLLGEHTDEVLREELDLSGDQIQDLRQNGIV